MAGRKDLPDAVKGYLLRTSAQIEYSRVQDDQALKDVEQAVAVFGYDIAAQRLLVTLRGPSNLADDLNVDLWTLRANPGDVATLVDVGRIADGLGLYAEATPWYAQAKTVLAHFRRDTTSVTLQIADHWLAANEPNKARKMLEPLASLPKAPAEAQLLLSEAYSMLGKTDEAQQAAMKALQPTTVSKPLQGSAANPASQETTASEAVQTPSGQQPTTQAPATMSTPSEVHAAALATAETFCHNSWVRMIYLEPGPPAAATAGTTTPATQRALVVRRSKRPSRPCRPRRTSLGPGAAMGGRC